MSSLYRRGRRLRNAILVPVERMLPRHLTVLCYHRIAAASSPGFYGFWKNASADAAEFSWQLQYLKQNYTVVGLEDVLAWLDGAGSMPPRPLLITFDDGYRDNLTVAVPALEALGLRAVFFIATDFVGGQKAFPWDYATEAILRSRRKGSVALPLLGSTDLEGDRRTIALHLVRTLKTVPGSALRQILGELAEVLDVAAWGPAPDGLLINWDDLREMAGRGHVIAPHSHTHANLANLSRAEACLEISQSRARIEGGLGCPVQAFAYPYGRPTDFTADTEQELAQQKFKLAFAASGGFSFLGELRRRPYAVRRVMIGGEDTSEAFVTKIGLESRLRGR